ncbi:MAG: DUF3299 domain-containing protein [Candidatus Sumerlaeaceae bacterium]|nr:DUF3299 domain-containing protein [Candidatus Sumerlaeaceae bacterium]
MLLGALLYAGVVGIRWFNDAHPPEVTVPDVPQEVRGAPLIGKKEIVTSSPSPLIMAQQQATRNGRKPVNVADVDEDTTVPAADPSGFKQITFRLLGSFNAGATPVGNGPAAGGEKSEAQALQIPPNIKSLDGQKVALSGYMVPVDIEEGKIRAFILVKNQMLCCFGVIPKLNEWVYVTKEDKDGAPYFPDTPVRASGTFSVGEEFRDGALTSLFRMKADKIEGPRGTPASPLP